MIDRLWGIILRMFGRLPVPNWIRWVLMWLVNQKFLVGAGALVFNERGEVLLFRHTYRKKYPWGIPGGWLKRKEDPYQAIEREICEETGLTASTLRLLWVGQDSKNPSLHLVFSARLEGGVFRPSAEVSEARFFALDDLPDLLPGQRELIIELIEQEKMGHGFEG